MSKSNPTSCWPPARVISSSERSEASTVNDRVPSGCALARASSHQRPAGPSAATLRTAAPPASRSKPSAAFWKVVVVPRVRSSSTMRPVTFTFCNALRGLSVAVAASTRVRIAADSACRAALLGPGGPVASDSGGRAVGAPPEAGVVLAGVPAVPKARASGSAALSSDPVETATLPSGRISRRMSMPWMSRRVGEILPIASANGSTARAACGAATISRDSPSVIRSRSRFNAGPASVRPTDVAATSK